MFLVILSFIIFIRKPIRIIRFLMKHSLLFHNRSVKFYFHVSFPTSVQDLTLVSEFLFKFKYKTWFPNSYLIQNWIRSFEFLCEFKSTVFFPNYCVYSISSSMLGSRILIPIRLLSFISYLF